MLYNNKIIMVINILLLTLHKILTMIYKHIILYIIIIIGILSALVGLYYLTMYLIETGNVLLLVVPCVVCIGLWVGVEWKIKKRNEL